mgnify:CR=1 FL=1
MVNWRTSNDSMQILEWTKKLIALRKKYGILHSRESLSLSDSKSLGYPDMSYHGAMRGMLIWRIIAGR